MTVSQITPSQQALFYQILAKENSSSNNNSSNLLSSLLNSSDLSPFLSLSNNNSTNNIFSSIMNMFTQMLIMTFLKDLLTQLLGTKQTSQSAQTSACTDGSCTASGTTATDSPSSASDETQQESKEIVKLTKDNIESDLRNQKGTSYVVACIGGCVTCLNFEPVFKSVNEALGSKATFYSINPIEYEDTYMTLKKESGIDATKSYGYPIIIKCVDGQAKEFYSYDDISSIYTDEEKMKEWFANKI